MRPAGQGKYNPEQGRQVLILGARILERGRSVSFPEDIKTRREIWIVSFLFRREVG